MTMGWVLLRAVRLLGACALMAAAVAHTALSAGEPLVPLPSTPSLDSPKVALGARLFADRRFAKDGSLACSTCHDLAHGGADTRPGSRLYSAGIGKARHIFNTPSVYNAAFNYRQQWTGGARTIDELVDKVIASPLVFDSSWPAVLGKLATDPPIVAEFERVYPGRGVSRETVQDALGAFARSLVTPSRFDRYLRGDAGAISADEKRGYERFKAYGCVGCHQGVNIGGNMMQRFGAMNDYFADRRKAGLAPAPGDAGRFLVTKKDEDLHVFKVPSLRNVALTAPYFHDGSAETLGQAVDVMFRYQLGRSAPAEDKKVIIEFLQTLNGEQFKAP